MYFGKFVLISIWFLPLCRAQEMPPNSYTESLYRWTLITLISHNQIITNTSRFVTSVGSFFGINNNFVFSKQTIFPHFPLPIYSRSRKMWLRAMATLEFYRQGEEYSAAFSCERWLRNGRTGVLRIWRQTGCATGIKFMEMVLWLLSSALCLIHCWLYV